MRPPQPVQRRQPNVTQTVQVASAPFHSASSPHTSQRLISVPSSNVTAPAVHTVPQIANSGPLLGRQGTLMSPSGSSYTRSLQHPVLQQQQPVSLPPQQVRLGDRSPYRGFPTGARAENLQQLLCQPVLSTAQHRYTPATAAPQSGHVQRPHQGTPQTPSNRQIRPAVSTVANLSFQPPAKTQAVSSKNPGRDSRMPMAVPSSQTLQIQRPPLATAPAAQLGSAPPPMDVRRNLNFEVSPSDFKPAPVTLTKIADGLTQSVFQIQTPEPKLASTEATLTSESRGNYSDLSSSFPTRETNPVTAEKGTVSIPQRAAVDPIFSAPQPATSNACSTRLSEAIEAYTHCPEPEPESTSMLALNNLYWEIQPHAHPMITAFEHTFIETCMSMLSDLIRQDGDIFRYAQKSNDKELQKLAQWAMLSESAPAANELLRYSLEAMLRENVRNGKDAVFVESGWLLSLGNKKLVKLLYRFDESFEGQLSVCWDWDVKLEGKPPQVP